MIKIGCCGFPVRRAEYYRHFAVVEIQHTFYQPPQVATAQKWRSEVDARLEFSLKAWQLITHPASSPTYRRLRTPLPRPERCGFFQPTREVRRAWEITRQIAQALQAKLVVFQCPGRFVPSQENISNLRKFFEGIQRDALILAWEPRGRWEDPLVRRLCVELDLVHCVDPFHRPTVHGQPAYFRLHGIGGHRYHYTNEDLQRLVEWSRAQKEAYCMFNNVSMFEDAQRFAEMIQARSLLGRARC
ncbi:MAG: DUF72 domain-containing protein [Chloroflexi bacterium]|nr:DUF72 domain-containing protein [Chloroflexota bacterium]